MRASQPQAASRLLADIRRAPDLYPYQEDTVRGLLLEITSLSAGVKERLGDAARDAEGRPRHRVLNEVQKCFLRRYKRCLVVYHSARCDRVENLRWNTGAMLPAAKRENMHSAEVDYFKAYSGLVSKYLDRCKLDLTAVRARGAPGRARARASIPTRPASRCLSRTPSPLLHAARAAEPQPAQAGQDPSAGHCRLRRGADRLWAAAREQGRDALYVARRVRAAGAPGPHDPGAHGLRGAAGWRAAPGRGASGGHTKGIFYSVFVVPSELALSFFLFCGCAEGGGEERGEGEGRGEGVLRGRQRCGG
jgi:hypothetical protein